MRQMLKEGLRMIQSILSKKSSGLPHESITRVNTERAFSPQKITKGEQWMCYREVWILGSGGGLRTRCEARRKMRIEK